MKVYEASTDGISKINKNVFRKEDYTKLCDSKSIRSEILSKHQNFNENLLEIIIKCLSFEYKERPSIENILDKCHIIFEKYKLCKLINL